MKRAFDIALALASIVIWGPLLLFIAGVIWVMDGRPVFFRQERVGRYASVFKIWKFRTMVANADKLGGSLTVGEDPRITRIGHWLRKSKLDELPQLINVLSGEMSFVGPRPEVLSYVELYDQEQRQVLNLRPGITDMASIKYRDESEQLAVMADPEKAYVDIIMPEKIRLNLEYAASANSWRDLLVIFKTLARVVQAA